jgi:exosortase A-associated hydrolase 1
MLEQGVVFNCEGRQLVAIEHQGHCGQKPNNNRHKGLVIVVGGPQTRVGSHRLFVYLARKLAKQGVSVFRFDYSGAGDSEGECATFEEIQTDIAAAIDTFQSRNPDITELSLWGLCDAASAILLYLQQFPSHVQIQQLFLVNPWVRQTHTQAAVFFTFLLY